MDKQTKKIVDAALGLPDFERSVLLNRLFSVLEGGNEKEVFEMALRLPEAAKWELVGQLQDSLSHLAEDPYDTVWREELNSRWLKFGRGEGRALTWEEVKQRTKRLLSE